MYEWPREENVPIDEIITKYEKNILFFYILLRANGPLIPRRTYMRICGASYTLYFYARYVVRASACECSAHPLNKKWNSVRKGHE